MGVKIEKSLFLKDPLLSKKKSEKLSVSVTIRPPKKRKDGREDYSDYSDLIRTFDRIHQIRNECNLTEAIVKELETYILRGLDLREVCRLAGIDLNVFKQWRHQYPLFDRFIDKCMVQAELDALDHVKVAMRGGQWQASAWFLERKWPRRYGKRDVTKQEVREKFAEFMDVVLNVVNDVDPSIRAEIVNRLRTKKIDFDG